MAYELSPINRLVSDVVEIIRHQAAERNIEIKTQLLDKELMVTIDPLRVQQVVLNMLSNAIKFSLDGMTIQLVMTLVFDVNSMKYNLKISVIDAGIGMSQEDQDNLFTPFFRSNSQQAREMNSNGHGLGMSICKSIAQQHGGDICVCS